MPDETGKRQPRLPLVPLDALPPDLTGGAVAIGNFDGVHLGHRRLIEETRAAADALGGPAVMLTFEPHPRTFFRPAQPIFRLTPPAAKARLVTALGFDGLVVARFDRELAARSAADFVADILVGRLAARMVFAGFDFHFGRDREGTPEFLRGEGARHDFQVGVIGPVLADDRAPYSATGVRQALAAGDIARANLQLGYRWFVLGEVIAGDRRGRDLGFPTANLRLDADCGLRHGIYAVRLTAADGVSRDAVASFGRRPTFDDGAPLLEVHVFDFAGSLYGQEVIVTFVDWLRGEEKFPSAAPLIAQMERDSAAARAALAASGVGGAIDRALLRIA